MQGTVKITLNQSTIKDILQEWAQKEFRTKVKVENVASDGYGDAVVYTVTLEAEPWRKDPDETDADREEAEEISRASIRSGLGT